MVRQKAVHHVPFAGIDIINSIVIVVVVIDVIVMMICMCILHPAFVVFFVMIPTRRSVAVAAAAVVAVVVSITVAMAILVGVDGRGLGGHGIGVLDGRRSSAATASASTASVSASTAVVIAAASALGRAVRTADHLYTTCACTCTCARSGRCIEALERIQAGVVVGSRRCGTPLFAISPSSTSARPRVRPALRHDLAGLINARTAVVVVMAVSARHCVHSNK